MPPPPRTSLGDDVNTSAIVRRLAKVAGIALIAGTVGGAALLTAEAVAARSRRYAKPDLGLAIRATLGKTGKPPLRLILLGDSTALGVGVDAVEDTVGGQLARMLAGLPDSDLGIAHAEELLAVAAREKRG